jgi:hypothetical protein
LPVMNPASAVGVDILDNDREGSDPGLEHLLAWRSLRF